MPKQVTAYCLDWHTQSSKAFNDLLVEPLQSQVKIKLCSWDGEKIQGKYFSDEVLVFCMLPPPIKLLHSTSSNLVWIPMWDQAQGYDQTWWNSLPKSLRIVAFSSAIYEKAMAAGLPVLRLTYFKDPKSLQYANWEHGRTLFYWNRTGMVDPSFITKLCKYLDINTLLFKPEIDPRIEANKFYELPERIGDTKVVSIKTTATREEFYNLTESANIVLAPRLTEGVGMVFLEALARGCAVLAHDAPTMNEYITSQQNGVLLTNNYRSVANRLQGVIGRYQNTSAAPFLLSDNQPWKRLSRLDYEQLGARARLDHELGYRNWSQKTDAFASFILKW